MPCSGKIGKTGDEIIFFQSAKNELKAGIVIDEKILDQTFGQYGADLSVEDRRIPGFANEEKRFRIAVAKAPHLEDKAVQTVSSYRFPDCMKDIEGPGGPAAGSSSDQKDRYLTVPDLLEGGFSSSLKFTESPESVRQSFSFPSFSLRSW